MPQNPSFAAESRLRLLSDASEIFRLNFPYTTVYPALGNLDVLPNLEAWSSAHWRIMKKRRRMRKRKQQQPRREKGLFAVKNWEHFLQFRPKVKATPLHWKTHFHSSTTPT